METEAEYETYEMQRLREIEQQRACLANECLLLYRTCENIALWNLGCLGGFKRYVLVVGFRYEASARPLESMRYAYDGHGPKLLLSSYANSHAEVELCTLERGLPLEPIGVEPLLTEIANVRRELRRLDRMQLALSSYAPGGTAYRKLVRKAAQNGMTRYKYRRHIRRPLRYL